VLSVTRAAQCVAAGQVFEFQTVAANRPARSIGLLKLMLFVTCRIAVASFPPGPMVTVPVPSACVAEAITIPFRVALPFTPMITPPVKVLFAPEMVHVPEPAF